MRTLVILSMAWSLHLFASAYSPGLDPIENMCIRFDQNSVTKNKTLYIDGGRQTFADDINHTTAAPGGEISTGYNNYLIAIDLSRSWTWKTNLSEDARNKTVVRGTEVMPPVLARGALWPGADDDDNIYLFGGTTSYMNTSFPGFQNPYPANYSMWAYNTVNKTWTCYDMSNGSPNRPSSGSHTYSKDSALGFFFNGQVDSGSSKETVGLGDDSKIFLEGMIVVDTNQRTARNISTAAVVGDMPRTRGRMIYLSDVGDNGILVQFGGNQKPINETTNTYIGDLIPMDSIDIFDIATITNASSSNSTAAGWYRQLATGDIPEPRVDFCIISASASDHSSQTIYMYGGRGSNNNFYDDVYALSVPSFTWIKLYSGTSPRYGHNCHRAGSSMITIGGAANTDYTAGPCDWERMGVGVYNMPGNTWSSHYDADAEDYTLPDPIVAAIGGTKDGGATKKVPTYGFAAHGLAKIFGAPDSAVNTTDAFASRSSSSSSSTTSSPDHHRSRTKLAIIIAASTLGGAILLAALCYLLRHHLHRMVTGGPFLPPEVDGRETEVQEVMDKEIFAELPGEARRVEMEEQARAEMDSARGSSSSSSSRGGSEVESERERRREQRRPPMYPWDWI